MKKTFVLLFVLALTATLAALPAVAGESAPVTLDDLFAPAGGSCAVASAELPAHEDGKAFELGLFVAGGPIGGGGQCNQAVCGPNEFCCNYSCSVCAPRGGACLDVYCPPES